MSYEPTHLKRWTMPSHYFGEVWPDYYVFLSRTRDSDELTESNYRVALAALESLPAFDGESRLEVRESHWACGWVEWIAIHADDEAALRAADEMAESLDSYPILDESDFSALGHDRAQEVWRDCYNARDRVAYMREHRRQFEVQSFADLLACARGKYFLGYACDLLH